MARVGLLVRDPMNRITLKAMLASEGHETVETDTGRLDVTVTDDFAWAGAHAKRTPCLVLAHAAEIGRAVDLMRHAGVYGYVFLPVQPGEVCAMVDHARLHDRTRLDDRALPGAPVPVAPLSDTETRAILDALRQCRNNRTRAARLLGIGRNTLWRKLKRMGQAHR